MLRYFTLSRVAKLGYYYFLINHTQSKTRIKLTKNMTFSTTWKRWQTRPLLRVLSNHLVIYPTPINVSYLWGYGSLSGLILALQIVTGIFLAIHYTPNIDYAFNRVQHIIRDVNNGWLIRTLHANGARCFFTLVYIHIFRGFYYGSYMQPRSALWCSGVVMLILMMAIGFIGYVLPWGQMRFWGATVITNLVSAIPQVGDPIVKWLWGGFRVGNATLNRFFRLHFALPFALVGVVILHLALLHNNGSNNPIGVNTKGRNLTFYPYFYVKDLFGFLIIIIVLGIFVFFMPNLLGHADNFIIANPIVTPAHIVPEWYFLPFYAILRSIPHKLGGIIAIGAALVGLMVLPFINTSEVRSTRFRPVFKVLFWIFVVNTLILGWIGQKGVEYPYVEIGQFATVFYFGFLFIGLPLVGLWEKKLIRQRVKRCA